MQAGARARLQAWAFLRVVQAPARPLRPVWAGLGAALLGGLGSWAGLAPGLQDELDAVLQEREQLQARLLSAPTQMPSGSEAVEPLPPSAAAGTAMASSWRWQQWARDAGLQLEQWQAGRTGGAGASWQLRLRGSYPAHSAWVARLASELAAPALLSYQLQATEGGLLTAELRLQPWPDPVRGGSAAVAVPRPVPLRDPFSVAPAPQPSTLPPPPWQAQWQRPPTWLEGSPLEDFEFTGTLRRGEHWVALLRWSHMLHTVREGDGLGTQRARVLRIDEHGLWLRELVQAEGGRWQERERRWRVGEPP